MACAIAAETPIKVRTPWEVNATQYCALEGGDWTMPLLEFPLQQERSDTDASGSVAEVVHPAMQVCAAAGLLQRGVEQITTLEK